MPHIIISLDKLPFMPESATWDNVSRVEEDKIAAALNEAIGKLGGSVAWTSFQEGAGAPDGS